MTDYERELLRHIIRQNDLILGCVRQALDIDVLQLERTFDMADDLDDVIADIGQLTTIQEGLSAVVDHAVSLLDDLDAKLEGAQKDPAKIAAIRTSLAASRDKLDAKKGELAAAVERGTPFDPSANA